ncbi:MAG: glycosyltransferase family 2 protein [Patescibacteria group bacterium]
MKLSIVITTRNREDNLLKCAKSIQKSKDLNFEWEIIIVDDNSSDGTQTLCSTDMNIKNCKFVHNSKQRMMISSRNIGARLATGKYVLFIDDDNIIDPEMIARLVYAADKHTEYGILGPSMYFLENCKKYLDFQKISFFTGKTAGKIDAKKREICDSDGVPNVFLIKKAIFDKCGYFDERLIQTYTEPDFAFNAKKSGFKCGIVTKALTYHDVLPNGQFTPRMLGGTFSQKSYCLIRNRTVIVSRYGRFYHKIIYFLFFSWLWPLLYTLLILKYRRFDLMRSYWVGFIDGIIYLFTKKLRFSYLK